MVISVAATRPSPWGTRAPSRPAWACWNDELGERYTVGAEEEIMLLDPRRRSLAQASDDVLARLSGVLAAHTAPETHAAVLELACGTGIVSVTRKMPAGQWPNCMPARRPETL